jgi:hypothetical protein
MYNQVFQIDKNTEYIVVVNQFFVLQPKKDIYLNKKNIIQILLHKLYQQ